MSTEQKDSFIPEPRARSKGRFGLLSLSLSLRALSWLMGIVQCCKIIQVIGIVVIASLARTHSARAQIDINVSAPTSNAVSGDDLAIHAFITSEFQVATVAVTVESTEAVLAFESGTLWSGNISLKAFESGSKTLVVTATDVFGTQQTEEIPFVLDRPPVVRLVDPMAESVIRRVVGVRASCADDDPDGCASISVSFEAAGMNPVVVAGVDEINEEISLESLDGRRVRVRGRGVDSRGQSAFSDGADDHYVYVESSDRLAEVATLRGPILDFDASHVFWYGYDDGRARIRDRSTGLDSLLPDLVTPSRPTYGYLTPHGAIWVAQVGPVASALNRTVLEWDSANLLDHGIPDSSWSLQVAGSYAAWDAYVRGVQLHNTLTGETQIVSAGGFAMSDVYHKTRSLAEDGALAFTSGGTVMVYKSGSIIDVADHPTLTNIAPVYDGINAVYAQGTDDSWSIVMRHAGGDEVLATGFTYQPNAGSSYQCFGGWVAYVREDAGPRQVFLRAPDGQEEQVTFFGSASWIAAMGPEGRIVVTNQKGNAQSNYIPIPGEPLQRVGSSLGRWVYRDGDWHVFIGRSLFRVSVDQPGFDGGVETPSDAGADAGLDAGIDAPTDASGPGDAGSEFDAHVEPEAGRDAQVQLDGSWPADGAVGGDAAASDVDASLVDIDASRHDDSGAGQHEDAMVSADSAVPPPADSAVPPPIDAASVDADSDEEGDRGSGCALREGHSSPVEGLFAHLTLLYWLRRRSSSTR